MVIDLSTIFAMRCPTCGRLETHQVNIFQLSGKKPYEIVCECGSRKITLQRKGQNHLAVKYYCIICDYEHSVIVPTNVFWSKNHLNSLICLDTDLNLGYYGPEKLIKAELDKQQKELNSMANELGLDDFVDPEIMLEVLDYLHDIAASEGLFCECGSHDINIDLFSDRVELSCNTCSSLMLVSAASKEDIEKLKAMDEVIIRLETGNPKNSKDPWINI